MPKPYTAAIVRHPEAGVLEVLNPGEDYAPDDPLVKAYPWAFAAPSQIGPVISVPVEQATAEPGEKRSIRRPR